jgi:glutathione S-transferase
VTRRLFHIARTDEWVAALAAGVYTMSTAGRTLAEVGFIHCAYLEQVIGVADRFFRGERGLVLIEIDPARCGARLVDEDLEGSGEEFPHLYGPLEPAAVVRMASLEPGPDGRFGLPEILFASAKAP